MRNLRGHLKGLAVALALALIAVGAYAVAASGHASPGWQPSDAQITLARRVAVERATSMDPDQVAAARAATTGGWPPNVRTAIFAESTHQKGILFTDDATTSDTSDVLIIEMTGDFKVALPSVPRGVNPIVMTHGVTLVIDAQSGLVLDATLEVPDRVLPDSAALK